MYFRDEQGETEAVLTRRLSSRALYDYVHTARNSHPETGPSDPCEQHRREMVTHGNGQ